MLPRLIIFDADGVLWRGGEVLPGAGDIVRRATGAGIRCVLLTNNSSLDRRTYQAKCQRLGLDFSEEDIFSTNYVAGHYFAQHHRGQSVLVVGSDMLAASVAEHVPATAASRWLVDHFVEEDLALTDQFAVLSEAKFDSVLLGIDFAVTYARLALAGAAVQNGARLIVSNTDPVYPFERGLTLPGNGSFVSIVQAVSGVKPVVIGKPGLYMLERIEAECGIGRGEMLLIGDKVETDIEMARAAGMRAVLPLTGVTTAEHAPPESEQLMVVENLAAAIERLGL
jgi:4-nitrophenyl phosphatase